VHQEIQAMVVEEQAQQQVLMELQQLLQEAEAVVLMALTQLVQEEQVVVEKVEQQVVLLQV
jgi:hypothetical protein